MKKAILIVFIIRHKLWALTHCLAWTWVPRRAHTSLGTCRWSPSPFNQSPILTQFFIQPNYIFISKKLSSVLVRQIRVETSPSKRKLQKNRETGRWIKVCLIESDCIVYHMAVRVPADWLRLLLHLFFIHFSIIHHLFSPDESRRTRRFLFFLLLI